MKSILALLVIVAVANAGIIKSGGLKGSWADEIVIINEDMGDFEAPEIALTGSDAAALEDYYNYFPNFDTDFFANVTEEFSTCGSTYLYFQFEVTNELTWYDNYYYHFQEDGGFEINYWTTVNGVTKMIPTSCSVYEDDNVFTCYVYLRRGTNAGVYNPLITLWDQNGNWAQYTETALAGSSFTVACNDPDVNAPTVTGEAISEDAIVLGMDDELQSQEVGGQTIISAVVLDNSYCFDNVPSDAENRDDWSSGINGVWATLTTGEDEDMMSVDIMLWEEEITTAATGATRYAAALTFANFAEPADYTIQIWATDYAGNVGMAATVLDLSVTYDDALLEENGGVFACQTMTLYVDDILAEDNEITTTNDFDSYDTAYITMTCVEKTEDSDNYVAVAYVSDPYMTTDETMEMTLTIWDSYAGNGRQDNFGQMVSWSYDDEDTYVDWWEPGTYVSIGYWSSWINVGPGTPEGSLWLSEVVTITSTGGIQRYNLADGAASSVAPSVFAVAVAAAFALFRL